MSKKIKVIVNPAAGAGKTVKKWPHIKQEFEQLGVDFDYELTQAPGHGIELANSAVDKGYEVVVSVGGDGTLNEIVNGLHHAGGLEHVAIAIVNTGTGADYIRTLGIPRQYKQACRRVASPQGKITVDLGIAEYTNKGKPAKRLFVNFAGLGFDAEIVRATTEKFKALGDMPSYLMGLLTTLFTYENRDPGDRRAVWHQKGVHCAAKQRQICWWRHASGAGCRPRRWLL